MNFLKGKPTPVDDTLPTPEQLRAADAVSLQDASGIPQPFSSLRTGGRRTIIVFLRHQFCGVCVDYVKELAKQPELAKLAPQAGAAGGGATGTAKPPQLILITHGSPDGIPLYKETTGASFDMYADPSKKLYHALGMERAYLDLGPDENASAYAKAKPASKFVLESFKRMAGAGTLAFKGGDYKQLGGEFVFDEEGKPIFVHRMQSTRDHTEPDRLAEVVGLAH